MTKYNLKIRKNTTEFETHEQLKNKECRELITTKLKEYYDLDYTLSRHQLFNILNKNKGRPINPLVDYFIKLEYAPIATN